MLRAFGPLGFAHSPWQASPARIARANTRPAIFVPQIAGLATALGQPCGLQALTGLSRQSRQGSLREPKAILLSLISSKPSACLI